MNEAPFRCSTLGQAPGLAHRHYNRLAILARDKQSSLLQKSLNYKQKSFITLVSMLLSFFIVDNKGPNK